MSSKIKFPLKYKILLVMIMIVFAAISVFFFYTRQTFYQDKKIFTLDLNMAVLRAVTSEITLALKSRLEELELVLPHLYTGADSSIDSNYLSRSSQTLDKELLGVSFYKKDGFTPTYFKIKEVQNTSLMNSNKLNKNILARINEHHPIDFSFFKDGEEEIHLLNRTIQDEDKIIPILSFVTNAHFLSDNNQSLILVIDLVQNFLIDKLKNNDLAQVFLLTQSGTLLSYPDEQYVETYASQIFPHPVTQKITSRTMPPLNQSLELDFNNEKYFCNILKTGFLDIYAISQIPESEAFLALHQLFNKTLYLFFFILSASIAISILFASRLTRNISLLKQSALDIGEGNFDKPVTIHSTDEIETVARSLNWMRVQLKNLIADSIEKARLNEELETTRIVQETLLSTPHIDSRYVELLSHYSPASQCGGDYWDAYLSGNKLTIFIGDATGHGAPSAIVTAVAKSCFSTLNTLYGDQYLVPEQYLNIFNSIIYDACKGRLLMTMAILQLDLATGKILYANAGHEATLWIRSNRTHEKNIISVFTRGERLGYSPDSQYKSKEFNIELLDSLFLFTDGVTEATREDGSLWGERNLRKVISSNINQPIETIKDNLILSVQDFVGETPQKDDITFLLLRWIKVMDDQKNNNPMAA